MTTNSLKFSFRHKVPIVLQAEASECGIACLAMIMGYHGHIIDIATFRRSYGSSSRGLTLYSLHEIAGRVGLNCRAIRLELDELDKLQTPCILHWGMTHFVVLVGVGRGSITIHDPARGQRSIGIAEVSREFSGVALEVSPTQRFERKNEKHLLRLRDMFAHVAGLKSSLIRLFVLSLAIEVIAITIPMFSQIIIDEVLVIGDRDLLTTVAAAMFCALIAQLAISAARTWMLVIVSSRVSLEWNTSLFDHLTRLPLRYFAQRHVGDVVSRFGSLSSVQHALTTDLVQNVLDGIMAVGMAVMLFIYGGSLAFLACIAIVIDVGMRLCTFRTYQSASEEAIIQDAKSQSYFLETIGSMSTVKMLNLRSKRKAIWVNSIIESMNIHIRLQKFDLLFRSIGSFLSGIDRLAMMLIGAIMVLKGNLTVGMLVAFLSYKDQFADRVTSLINTGFSLKMMGVQTARLSDIVMTEPETSSVSPVSKHSAKFSTGKITANSISARHSVDDPWIFRNLSFEIPSGKSIAITGTSGCGKTTLIGLLAGITLPSEGTIMVDGVKIIPELTEDYRSIISGVMQNDSLYSGTIAENIASFDDPLDRARIERCAQYAAIDEDIAAMPMGYETLIGNMGAGISGGQKQRVLLARALYKSPKVLFLDEATSHLDEATEAKVVQALSSLKMTRVMIAHRPATIAHADIVYLLNSEGLTLLKYS